MTCFILSSSGHDLIFDFQRSAGMAWVWTLSGMVLIFSLLVNTEENWRFKLLAFFFCSPESLRGDTPTD
jgi:hypothetical protein